jgi:hypothetical protein
MSVGLLDHPMAKKKGRPEKGRNDVTVRMDAALVHNAKVVASFDGKSLAEYLSDAIAPVIERDLKRVGGRLMNPRE